MAELLDQWIWANRHDTILGIIKGFRNGIVYGAKVRFPHALVMTLLFKRHLKISEMILRVWQAVRKHATMLGTFVVIYKSTVALLRNLLGESGLHPMFAGLIGGLYISDASPVSQQISLYILSRVVLAFYRIALQRGYFSLITTSDSVNFKLLGGVVWALVMWLFQHEEHSLQGSLQSSMTYLYRDSSVMSDLRTFLWHNK